MKLTAEMGAYSSVVGNSVHLLAEDGRMLGQVAILCHTDDLRDEAVQADLCRTICGAINATSGVELIAAERRRQIEDEGWTADHDDEQTDRELKAAAGAYLIFGNHYREPGYWGPGTMTAPPGWPSSWDTAWWKPKDTISDLIRAGALIAAEIDRVIRAEERAKGGAE